MILENPSGTAPGQWLDTRLRRPSQAGDAAARTAHRIKADVRRSECMPRLREALPQRFIAMRTLKAAMIGESACDARIAPIYKQYKDVETTILAQHAATSSST